MNEWYKEWFGPDYLRLYAHRDDDEAGRQVEFLLEQIPAMAPTSIARSRDGTSPFWYNSLAKVCCHDHSVCGAYRKDRSLSPYCELRSNGFFV